jgi:3-hydroxybutyryl-CoA dehydrogenase
VHVVSVVRIKKVGVVGAGTMGHQIAQVSAQAGYEVVLVDVAKEILDKALNRIRSNIEVLKENGVKVPPTEEVLSRITGTTNLEDVRDADLIIEAVPEDLKLKQEVFSKLDKIVPQHSILASNTSSLRIRDLALSTSRPDKVLGLHFFSPVYIIPVVEVVKTDLTSKESLDYAINYVKSLGKHPLVCKDVPGFILNRVTCALGALTASLLDEGLVEDPVALDLAIRLVIGLRLPFTGPLQIMDLGGLDVWLSVLESLYKQLNDPRYKPPRILEEKVRRGELGFKTGKGFYQYTDDSVIKYRDKMMIKLAKDLGYL